MAEPAEELSRQPLAVPERPSGWYTQESHEDPPEIPARQAGAADDHGDSANLNDQYDHRGQEAPELL